MVLVLFILSVPVGFTQATRCTPAIDSLIALGSPLVFSHPDSSLVYFEASKQLAEDCRDSSGIVKSENFIGLYESNKGNYDKASEHYFYALGIAIRNDFSLDIGIIKNNLGAMNFDTGELEKSKIYYEEALTIMLDLQDSVWIGKIYGNVAGVYFMEGAYEASIITLEKSIEYARLTKHYEAMGGALSNLAMVKIAIGQTESAFEGFDEGIRILDSIGDKRGVAITLIEKANSLSNNGQDKNAISSYNEAMQFAREVSHVESIKKALLGLSKVHEKLGEFDQAFYTTQELIQFQDSILQVEKYEISLDLEEKYQSSQKEQKIAFLEKQEILNDKVVSEQQKVNTYLIILVLILALFFGFVWFQWFKKKKINQLLQSQNAQIEDSLKERELLIREVHHRVKNNLQIVSGMLNIQANSGVDEKTKAALLENRKRVQSMSIVHQKLYQHKDINEVHLKEYLSHLVDEVESHYDFEGGFEVEVITDIEAVSLPIDLTIPLGLILTEVLSNCYKHAFNDVKTGTISVQFAKTGVNYSLTISDSGTGIDKTVVRADSFGMKLIQSLAKSLNAECSWKSENGTIFKLNFTHE